MKKNLRYPVRALFYGSLVFLAFWFAYELRMMEEGADSVAQLRHSRWVYVWWVVPFKLMLLYAVGQFHGALVYFRLPDALRICGALIASGVFLLLSARWSDDPARFLPRSVALIDLNFSVIAICGARLALRLVQERIGNGHGLAGKKTSRRVAIIGAGDAGAALCAEMLAKPALGMTPAVFFDDDRSKQGLEIHGVPVRAPISSLAKEAGRLAVSEVILAIPSAEVHRVRELHTLVSGLGLKLRTVPSLLELTSGRVQASDLRPVQIEDLLGRPPVPLDDAGIAAMVENRVVMVTGGGGSIGSEICRQVCRRSPARLIIVEQCEALIYHIEHELVAAGYGGIVTPVVADVMDAERIESVFSKYKPAIVLHAAAHKHVPLMEIQPGEAVRNNCLGTHTVALAALRHGAERFTLISTDKAINPTNAMGASKRLAEITLQSLAGASGSATKFMAVRFGNVLGSSGSVIPLFKKQIAAGGPVTVTHPDMTRYFMTIPEAVGLVLQASTLGEGGEIFVLDMGEPVKIADLARQLVTLSGLRPDVDIEIRYTGLRPGEKLFEELRHTGEEFAETKHPRIARFKTTPLPSSELENFLSRVRAVVAIPERNAAKLAIRELVPEYTPYLD